MQYGLPVGSGHAMPSVHSFDQVIKIGEGSLVPGPVYFISVYALHIYTQIKSLVTKRNRTAVNKIRRWIANFRSVVSSYSSIAIYILIFYVARAHRPKGNRTFIYLLLRLINTVVNITIKITNGKSGRSSCGAVKNFKAFFIELGD